MHSEGISPQVDLQSSVWIPLITTSLINLESESMEFHLRSLHPFEVQVQLEMTLRNGVQLEMSQDHPLHRGVQTLPLETLYMQVDDADGHVHGRGHVHVHGHDAQKNAHLDNGRLGQRHTSCSF